MNDGSWDGVLQSRYGDKLKPKTASTADATETAEEVEASIRAEVAQYQQDVRTACELGGVPGRAGAFIAANTPLSDVLAALAGTTATRPSERPTPEQRHRARLASKG